MKRRQALLESIPPRNNWLQTHQDDGTGGGAGMASPAEEKRRIGLIDLLMP